jgi:hypothetical protein
MRTGRDRPTDELRLDELLGRRVLGPDNHSVGRLEEVRASVDGATIRVDAYVLGAGGLLERLGVGLRRVIGLRVRGRVARWDQIDVTDPCRPRLTCSEEELEEA